MERFFLNLKFALRLSAKDPAFTVAVIGTIATCLAANVAIFVVVNSVILKPLPFPQPDRLVVIGNEYPGVTPVRGFSGVPDYFDRLGQTDAFEAIALYRTVGRTVGTPPNGEAERVTALEATPSFFHVLHAQAYRGRLFLPEEGEAGQQRKIVLSYGLWQRLFGGRDDAIGAELRSNGVVHIVVGVLPPGFRLTGSEAQMWIPAVFTPADRSDERRHNNTWFMLARLKPGATVKLGQRQIDALNARNFERFPQFRELLTTARFRTVVSDFQQELIAQARPILVLLWGGALIVLAIGAVNLANLAVIRATARARELTVRLVLGAELRALASQILTETMVVVGAGGVMGLLLGWWALRLLPILASNRLPRLEEVALDATTIAYTAGLTVLVVLGVALAPILRVRRAASTKILQDDGRASTASHGARLVRQCLAVSQVAFTFVLLGSAGLLITSFRHVLDVDLGFKPDHVLTASFTLPSARYDLPQVVTLQDRIVAAIRALPSVEAAGITSNVPLGENYSEAVILADGQQRRPGDAVNSSAQVVVSDGYLEAMGLRLVRGRTFAVADTERSPRVVVIDEHLARSMWGDTDPIGRRMYVPTDLRQYAAPPDDQWLTVIGVVADARLRGPEERSRSGGAFYLSHRQLVGRNVTLAIKTNGDPALIAPATRRAIAGFDAEVPLFDVKTMNDRIDRALVGRRASMFLVVTFASVALLLVVVGLYGVLGFEVRLRTREIAIRMALGAATPSIFRLVLLQGVVVVALGSVLGVLGIVALRRILDAQLVGVTALSPSVLGAVVGVVTLSALAACCSPAWQAVRTNVVRALTTT